MRSLQNISPEVGKVGICKMESCDDSEGVRRRVYVTDVRVSLPSERNRRKNNSTFLQHLSALDRI